MRPTSSLLSKAVHHHSATSRRGALERLFTMWFRGFVYNQIWEDPRVDAEALRLDTNSNILTISSGGCNVLNYLLWDPAKIVAVDLNGNHMNLTRLKIAALKHLPDYQSFYQFFGLGRHPDNVDNYYKYIRDHLDADGRKYWEASNWAARRLGRRKIKYFKRGLYDQSKLGKFISLMHRFGRLAKRDPRKLLAATTIEEQQKIFDGQLGPIFDHHIVKWVSRLPIAVFSLGIPPSQHEAMLTDSGGQIVENLRQRVRKLATRFPLEDNYFAWQAFGRTYDHNNQRALPEYLREENYNTLRERIERVETHVISLQGYLRQAKPGSINSFIFLDSQDWMPPEVIAELWDLVHQVGASNSRVIFRTAGEVSPIEPALPPALMQQFVCERELAERLHEEDRSAIYGMFHIYSKAGA